MSGAELLGMLAGMPADQLKYPVVFIRASALMDVSGVMTDEPGPGERGEPVLLLLSGGTARRWIEPPPPSIGDRGRY